MADREIAIVCALAYFWWLFLYSTVLYLPVIYYCNAFAF